MTEEKTCIYTTALKQPYFQFKPCHYFTAMQPTHHQHLCLIQTHCNGLELCVRNDVCTGHTCAPDGGRESGMTCNLHYFQHEIRGFCHFLWVPQTSHPIIFIVTFTTTYNIKLDFHTQLIATWNRFKVHRCIGTHPFSR